MSRPAALAALVLVVAACSGSALERRRRRRRPARHRAPTERLPSADARAASAPSSTRPAPTDVILRYDEGGGFVHAGLCLASQAPIFTLYGDGTVVFRNPTKDGPAGRSASVCRSSPFRTAQTERGADPGDCSSSRSARAASGAARAEYPNIMVADASTAIFTINAGGLAKTVSVYALGIDAPDGRPTSLARAGLREAGATASPTSTRAARSRPTSTRPTRYRGHPARRPARRARRRRPGRGRTSRRPTS